MASQGRHYGIHEIYKPEGVEAEVDIVAVHGLNGEALKTWTSTKENICWLNHPDFLPKYIANARVLVWGYNSSISNMTGPTPSKDRIHHHAQTLVAQLYADRKLEKRETKPIVFLCHSLGGIVVKRALSYASSRSSAKISHIQSIATCTYGILFFGTPHHGSSKTRLLGTLQKLTSLTVPSAVLDMEPGLVVALEEESETLQNITDYFVPLMKNYCIYFFWEQEKTSLKYTKDYIVTETSAAPTFDETERAGIPANHSNMVKFNDSRSSSFRSVMAALQKYCEEGPYVIHDRWTAAERDILQERKREAFEKIRRLQNTSFTTCPMSNHKVHTIDGKSDECPVQLSSARGDNVEEDVWIGRK